MLQAEMVQAQVPRECSRLCTGRTCSLCAPPPWAERSSCLCPKAPFQPKQIRSMHRNVYRSKPHPVNIAGEKDVCTRLVEVGDDCPVHAGLLLGEVVDEDVHVAALLVCLADVPLMQVVAGIPPGERLWPLFKWKRFNRKRFKLLFKRADSNRRRSSLGHP